MSSKLTTKIQVFHEHERQVLKRSQLVSNRGEKNDLVLNDLMLVQWVTKRLHEQLMSPPSLYLFPKNVYDALEIRHYWSVATVCPGFQVNIWPQRLDYPIFFKVAILTMRVVGQRI